MPIQKVMDTDELKAKVPPITIAFIVGMVTLGFLLGVSITKMQMQDEIQKIQHAFSLEEVQGLRNDVLREDSHLQKQIDELKKKLEEVSK